MTDYLFADCSCAELDSGVGVIGLASGGDSGGGCVGICDNSFGASAAVTTCRQRQAILFFLPVRHACAEIGQKEHGQSP